MNPTHETTTTPDGAPIEYRRDDTPEQAQEKGRRAGAGGLPDIPPSTYRVAALKKAWRYGWAQGARARSK
jgi:hypothetical protein